ncbi:MAG: trypsin-like serine protease [Deltaproteobacteria bacterium]|nr:trypsin-like serine protease [Deltaproteobacteria bacterium]
MKFSFFVSALAIVAAVVTGPAAWGIVSANPASGDPNVPDPHLVTGLFDINQHVFLLTDLPAINPDGVVEIEVLRTDRSLTCSAAVIHTPTGPQNRAVLTAAHCVDDPRVRQVSVEIDEQGLPTTYQTCHGDAPGCVLSDQVLVHPSYVGVRFGYDLALIYFESPMSGLATAYQVSDSSTQPFGPGLFVKFGFGCSGYGGDGVDDCDLNSYDHQKRWAVNRWDSLGLGNFGVEVDGTPFLNNHTQLVLDFDKFTQIDNNLFNFYQNTFDPATGYIEIDNQAYSWGVGGGEGWGCAGDSGGPNFVFDLTTSTWVIRAVNSYVLRMDDDYPGFAGNSDFTAFSGSCSGTGRDFSFGEFEGDALVTRSLLDQVLGLAPTSPTPVAKGKVEPNHGAMGFPPPSQR